MKPFTEFSQQIQLTHSLHLLKESQEHKQVDEILDSIDDLCDELVACSLISEESENDEHIKSLLNGEPIVVDGVDVLLSKNKDGLFVNDVFKEFPGAPGHEFNLEYAISVMLDDIDYYTESYVPSDVEDAVFNMPADADSFSGYEFDLGGGKVSLDWDSESGVVAIQLNGNDIDSAKDKRVYDYESLKQTIVDVLSADAGVDPEPKQFNPEMQKKLSVLNTIIRPRLINKFANTDSDQKRIYNAIKSYIKSGEDETHIKTELDQRAIVDFCLDILDVLLTNRNLAGLVARDSVVAESRIVEKYRKRSETIDIKLDMLLKLGLVDAKIYSRAKRALSNKKSAGTVPYLRGLLFDLLDKIFHYIKKDPTLYNRIRLNVMKEFKTSLPSKKNIEEASAAGNTAAASGSNREVPEVYSNHHFTKEAWFDGYDSYRTNEEKLQSFKEFRVLSESDNLSLSEVDIITNVVEQLASISNSSYLNLEEAINDVSVVVSELGLSFDINRTLDLAYNNVEEFDIVLDDLEGSAKISIADDIEDGLEGNLVLKFVVQKTDEGVVINPEIVVYFENDSVALSDIEFDAEVELNDDECPACELSDCECGVDEEYIDGQTYNVTLFNPDTRGVLAAIVNAESLEEARDTITEAYPLYTIHEIRLMDIK